MVVLFDDSKLAAAPASPITTDVLLSGARGALFQQVKSSSSTDRAPTAQEVHNDAVTYFDLRALGIDPDSDQERVSFTMTLDLATGGATPCRADGFLSLPIGPYRRHSFMVLNPDETPIGRIYFDTRLLSELQQTTEVNSNLPAWQSSDQRLTYAYIVGTILGILIPSYVNNQPIDWANYVTLGKNYKKS